jgi:SPP1 family predicted phage head-tail adaptor
MKPARIGDLDRRLVLETRLDVPDDIGGVVRSWVFVDVVWSRVVALSGAQRFEGEREESAITHVITLRWRPDVTGAMRLRDGARVYAIHAAIDGDDRRRTLSCRCSEIS